MFSMFKWLRSWFAWRFSLTRLVVAVVFLGAFIGLNMRKIGPRRAIDPRGGQSEALAYSWGWPLPVFLQEGDLNINDALVADSYRLPLTHQTYLFCRGPTLPHHTPLGLGTAIINCTINVLFALTVLSLILFLQIPRRKVVAKVE